VVAEVVLIKEEVEVCLPWMVVVVVAGELDGNMVGDGDIAELGGGRGGEGGGGGGSKGVASGGDGGHGGEERRIGRLRWWGRGAAALGGSRARVRIVGCLIPCREDVMHDVLIRCIGTHIYRLHGGTTMSSTIQKRRGPSVNIQDTYVPYNMYSTYSHI
jgi:hypothetical protein